MANASIGGLVSGLDTATIISQLMQLEARPQTMLKSRVSSEQRTLTALQTLNSKLANIATKAAELAKADSWLPMKATSSNAGVTVSADSTAQLTSLSFDIGSTATTSLAVFKAVKTQDEQATAAASFTITYGDGTSKTLSTGSGSLQDIAAAINDETNDTGLSATLVRAGTDPDGAATYRLNVASVGTGVSSGFSFGAGFLDGVYTPSGSSAGFTADATFDPTTAGEYTFTVDGQATTLDLTGTDLAAVAAKVNTVAGLSATVNAGRLQIASTDGSAFSVASAATNHFEAYLTAAGTDAEILINGQSLTSSTNTFTDLMPGVDVTLASDAENSATISIARDTDSLSGKVKSLVDAVNLAMDEISSLTKTSGEAKERGLLSGDSTLRGIRSQLLETVTGGINLQSLQPYGIETDRSGKFVFDEAKFKAAYDADPTATTAMFVTSSDPAKDDGFAGAVSALAKGFSDSIDGTVTAAIKSRQSQIKGWEDDIADWDVRLDARRTALERQYTALESALGKLQSQGNWLAGQIAGLPKMSSGQ